MMLNAVNTPTSPRGVKNALRLFTCVVLVALSTSLLITNAAAENENGKPAKAQRVRKKWAQGEIDQPEFPFQGACIGATFPANNIAMKGLAIRLDNNASVLFDTDLLRYAAGWTGAYLNYDGVAFSGS